MAVWSLFSGRTATLRDSGFWSGFFGGDAWSGKTVTEDSALQLATVFACVKLTAQAASSMPIGLYEKGEDGNRRSVSDTVLAELLQDSPNQDQTPAEFWEAMVSWMMVNGNAYAEKGLSGDKLTSLNPIAADSCSPFRNDSGDLFYRVRDRGQNEDLPSDKIFHLKGFGMGGDLGLSTVRYGAQTFGAAMATDEAAAKVFANGMHASGILSAEQKLSDVQRGQLATIMQQYVSSKNAGKMMILESGLKYQQLTLNPEDAQMLETRRFAIEEMCRWFGLPPIMIGHASQGQTMWGSGVEQILIQWLVTGLNPLLKRIEQRIRKSLIKPHEAAGTTLYAEFNREGLLQADSAAKATFLAAMVNNGLMTRNEGRSKLNLPKMAGGDVLTVQMQMQPIGQVGTPTTPVPIPAT